MNEKDILKRAVELYEREKNSNSEAIDRATLSEMNIPQEFYEKARKEISLENQKQKKADERSDRIKKKFLPMILVLLGFFIYHSYKNFMSPFPEVNDFNYKMSLGYLEVDLKITSESSDRFQVSYKLLKPDGKLYEMDKKNLYFKSRPSQNLKIKTKFSSKPEKGKWKIEVFAKLSQFGINEKKIFEKNISL